MIYVSLLFSLNPNIFCSVLQHKTIDSVLARGEKLDSLVEKSSDLSMASQVNILSSFSQLIQLSFLFFAFSGIGA